MKGDTGNAGPQGPEGPQGPQGAAGSAGAAGADGKTVLSGSGTPASGTGANGDFYYDTAGHDFYGPKSAGAWGSGTHLIGPQGIQGVQGDVGAQGPQGNPGAQGPQGTAGTAGAAGADGKTVRNGSGAPSSGLGADGDFYIDTTAHSIYGPKTAGAWGSATSLVGPQGATGSQGIQGIQGIQGVQGNTGAQGAPGLPGEAVGDTFMVPIDVRATSTAAVGQANAAEFLRWTCPKTGTLAGLAVRCGTASGNYDIGIYDSGDADTTKLTPLYRKGSTALTGAAWNTASPSGISVVAGHDYFLAFAPDNATATFTRTPAASPSVETLPAGYAPLSGGASVSRLAAKRATSFPLPAAFATSDLVDVVATPPVLLVRVT